jgi:hypothetical protein
MEEYKSLAEWLESKGNPKHGITKGNGENMVLVVEDQYGMMLYTYTEKELPDGKPYFWMSSGWGVRKEFFPAIKTFLDEADKPEFLKFEVWEWHDDEEGEYENRIDIMDAVSEYHARALLRDRMRMGKYPKGSWLVYYLDGKKIELDSKGRIPA